MTDDGYTPLIDREREQKSRVHEELTEPARERLVIITDGLAEKYRPEMIYSLMKKAGTSPFNKHVSRHSSGRIKDVHSDAFIQEGDTIHVLTYIELIVKKFHTLRSIHNEYNNIENVKADERVQKIINDIRNVLVTEGILWEVNQIGDSGVVEFTPLESHGMKEIDEELQTVAASQPWGTALRGYNAAFDRYLNGDFDEQIPKKLYNSIEAVLQTICVEEEGWTENENLPHSDYLEMLKDHGVYDAHGVTAPELGSLLDSLEKMVAKVSDDRKQRHVYHDRAYSTLLIHQVGAYLYFLINRYEQFSQEAT